jgi:hypothetical protein
VAPREPLSLRSSTPRFATRQTCDALVDEAFQLACLGGDEAFEIKFHDASKLGRRTPAPTLTALLRQAPSVGDPTSACWRAASLTAVSPRLRVGTDAQANMLPPGARRLVVDDTA